MPVGFIRFRLLEIPLERDEGEYAYAGRFAEKFYRRVGVVGLSHSGEIVSLFKDEAKMQIAALSRSIVIY